MGVYSDKSFITDYTEEVDLLNDPIDTTGVLDIEEGAMTQLMVENERNYALMMKVVGISELAAIERDGEAIYESSDVSGFFGKIKEFFKNILEKLKRLFKNFAVKFDSWTKSNKDFVNKYKKQLAIAKTTDFKFDGFKYNNLDGHSGTEKFIDEGRFKDALKPKDANGINGSIVGSIIDTDPDKVVGAVKYHIDPDTNTTNNNQTDIKKLLDSIDEDYTDIQDNLRASVAAEFIKSNEKSMDSNEFIDELFKGFRSGEDKKEELELSDVGGITSLMTILLNDSKVQSDLNKQFSANKKFIDGYTKALDKAQTTLLKDTPTKNTTSGSASYNVSNQISIAVRAVSVINRSIKDYQQYWIQAENAFMRAIKDRAAQAKAVCAKVLTYKAKNEDVDYSDEGFGVTHSAFDSVRFV